MGMRGLFGRVIGPFGGGWWSFPGCGPGLGGSVALWSVVGVCLTWGRLGVLLFGAWAGAVCGQVAEAV